MKRRLIIIVALVALFGGLAVVPAGAAGFSSNTNVVNDTATNSPWTGNESFGSGAYDTSVVTPDNSTPAGGTLTYTLFSGATCGGSPLTTAQVVTLNPDGTVPNSDPTSNLDAGTYSFDAIYNGDTVNDPSSGVCESFAIGQATPTQPMISNLPSNPTWTSGGGFTASLSGTNSDGTPSVSSSTTSVCTASGLGVTYVAAGTCTLTAQTAASTNFAAASGSPETFTIGRATPSPTPSISNVPSNPTWSSGGGFTAQLTTTDSNGTPSVISSTPSVCNASGLAVSYVTAGTCTLTAELAQSTDFEAASGGPQSFTIQQVTPIGPTITNIPSSPRWGSSGGFTAQLGNTDGSDGTPSVTSNTTSVCTTSGLAVTYVTAGTCTLTAQTTQTTNFAAASGSPETFTIVQATPTPTPSISNLPSSPTSWSPGGGFTAVLNATNSDGTQSVTSSTTSVCTASGLVVTYVTVGTCTLTPQTAASTDFAAASGSQRTFTIARAAPTQPTITNVPSPANEFFDFTAIVGTTGDGATSVTSSTPNVCSVGTNGLTVNFVGFGACSLTPSVAQGQNYNGATGSKQTFMVQEASHWYWLVGSDGGIFSFGSAAFHGSMGSTHLQRPVVGITPTSTGNGYWLPASDGGIFSFGDSTYYGSLPGLGFHPSGSGQPQSLNAPIVGMVPTLTGHGYFMVASDGGVFAFGDARFEGSCPGIGGCAGIAVAVMPDHSGKGYWLVTNVGGVYAFGDASFYGAPPANSVHVVGAVQTSDGGGYWLLYANGVVATFGDAINYGAPTGYVNGFNPATTIFPTLDSRGYWVASARGDVFAYGDSPFLGSMAGAGLNGEVIGAFGF
jgi:hypothetical protein